MSDEPNIVDINILIQKAHKKWQKIFAWFFTIPVKIIAYMTFVYYPIALLFGPFAIVFLTGALIYGDTRTALDWLYAYIPFFVILFLIYLTEEKTNKYVTAFVFFFSNIVCYVAPLTYGAYCLRYNSVVEKLKIAEYDRLYDNYCNEMIDVYKKRRALFSVYASNHIVENMHVGNSWSFFNNINNVPLKNGHIEIWIADNDTIELKSYAFEDDVYVDAGFNIAHFKIPWHTLINQKMNLSHYVTVIENRGRYFGGICRIECKYTLDRVSEYNMFLYKKINDFLIPKDSVMKYFFNFHKIYEKHYNRSESPWVEYMTEDDKKLIKSIKDILKELPNNYLRVLPKDDKSSRYRID